MPVQKNPLPENNTAYQALEKYTESRNLIVQYGKKGTSTAAGINGVRYVSESNAHPVSEFSLHFEDDDNGCIQFTMEGKSFRIDFGLCRNKFYDFSFGTRPVADMMGRNEVGAYNCAVSGAWVDEATFAIHLQVIDTYFGSLNIHIAFEDDFATLLMKKSGQYVFDGIGGYVIARKAYTNI